MRSKEQTLAMRKKYLGLSLSLAYNEPLKIVRGKGQYLYDEKGRDIPRLCQQYQPCGPLSSGSYPGGT